jgi:hypothetical protein
MTGTVSSNLFFLDPSHLLSFGSLFLFCCYIDRVDEEEEPKAHGSANTAPPTRWSSLRIVVSRRKHRLSRNMTQKHRLQCPAPEHQSPRKLKLGLLANMSLLPGVCRSGPLLEDVSYLFLFVAFF